jgi:hypothetical protein
MTNPELKQFLESLNDSEMLSILEVARVALQDADIAFEVAWEMSMSDADLNNIQHKVHLFMESL